MTKCCLLVVQAPDNQCHALASNSVPESDMPSSLVSDSQISCEGTPCAAKSHDKEEESKIQHEVGASPGFEGMPSHQKNYILANRNAAKARQVVHLVYDNGQ